MAREFGIPLRDEGPTVEDADPAGGRVEEDLKIRGRREAERLHTARKSRRDLASMTAFVGDQESAAKVRRGEEASEIMEALDDFVDRLIKIEVIFFHVVDQGHRRSVVMERSIELAGLCHEDSGSVTVIGGVQLIGETVRANSRSSPDLRTVGTGDETRIEIAVDEDVGEHRRGRALPVGPGDGNGGSADHRSADRFGVTQNLKATICRGRPSGMLRRDRGTGDHQFAVFGKINGGGPGPNLDAGGPKRFHRWIL